MTAEHVDRLMKRCQIGVGGRRALEDAHEIMAECYGTLGAQQARIAELEAQVDALRAERDALKVERDEWAEKWHQMRRQYGEMRWPGMTRVVTASDAAMNQPKESGQ